MPIKTESGFIQTSINILIVSQIFDGESLFRSIEQVPPTRAFPLASTLYKCVKHNPLVNLL